LSGGLACGPHAGVVDRHRSPYLRVTNRPGLGAGRLPARAGDGWHRFAARVRLVGRLRTLAPLWAGDGHVRDGDLRMARNPRPSGLPRRPGLGEVGRGRRFRPCYKLHSSTSWLTAFSRAGAYKEARMPDQAWNITQYTR